MKIRAAYLWCDSNAAADCVSESAQQRTLTEAVRKAKEAGWHVGRHQSDDDVCPACQQVEAVADR